MLFVRATLRFINASNTTNTTENTTKSQRGCANVSIDKLRIKAAVYGIPDYFDYIIRFLMGIIVL
jgi:hypothetical protein